MKKCSEVKHFKLDAFKNRYGAETWIPCEDCILPGTNIFGGPNIYLTVKTVRSYDNSQIEKEATLPPDWLYGKKDNVV